MLRRQFLQAAVAASTVSGAPAPPTGAHIPLGFDTYSLRAFGMKAPELIDFAAAQKLDTIQLSSLNDYASEDAGYLAQVRDRAARAGLHLEAGIGCVCPISKSYSARQGDPAAYIVRGLRVAKAIGATAMRCFMGSEADRGGPGGIAACMDKTIQVFRSVRAQALDSGVMIALENHAGDMQARETRTVILESGRDFVGSCLDTGNPMWVVEDPLVTLEVLGLYAVTTHLRDSVVYEHPRGAAAQWVALGDGIVDFPAFLSRFRQLAPRANLQLENITGRPARVLPYLEPEFWKVFPNANAAEFARFVALARRGRPFSGFMVVEDGTKAAPPAFAEALKEQQRVDLIRGLDYAKKVLDAGNNWRV